MLFAVGDAIERASKPVAADPVMLACSVSVVVVAPHPLSWYVKLATPLVVVAEAGVSVDLDEAMHADVIETMTGVPGTVPDSVTWTPVCP